MEVAKEKDEIKDQKVKKKVIEVLEELETLKENRKDLWNISWETGEFLNFLTFLVKPKKILEIGMSNGFSTIWLSKDNLNSKVFTIEVRENIIKEAINNFSKAKIENINILKGEALKILKNLKEKFDLIFIDANKTQYIEYIKILEKNECIKDNTLIIADNIISHKTTEPYLKYIQENYKTIVLNIGKGLSLSIKK